MQFLGRGGGFDGVCETGPVSHRISLIAMGPLAEGFFTWRRLRRADMELSVCMAKYA